MSMSQLRIAIATFAIVAVFSTSAIGQTTAEARIIYAYMGLHGRKPDSKELQRYTAQNFKSLREAYNAIKTDLNASSKYDDPKAYSKKIMIMKCYRDALGYNASVDEVKYWLTRSDNDSYSALFDNHMNYANNIYDAVINNAHRNTVFRDATPQEMAYWKDKTKSGKIPAYIIEGYIKSRAQKGGYKLQGLGDLLGGLSASFVNFFVVPIQVLSEAVQTGLPPANYAGNLEESLARMVAAGGGNLVGNDGASMVAAGGGNMVAAGGGN